MSAATIAIRLNGESVRCPAGLTLLQLLEQLGYRPTAGNQGRLDALREPLPCWSAVRYSWRSSIMHSPIAAALFMPATTIPPGQHRRGPRRASPGEAPAPPSRSATPEKKNAG